MLINSSCQTTPTRYETIQKAKWQAKMLVRDLKAAKSQVVNTDLVAIYPGRLRMEVTTSLGMHLATFVMLEEKMTILLPGEKRILEGPANAHGMKAILGVPLEPSLILNLLFDKEPSGTDWSCQKNDKKFLESCENLKQKMKIMWADRDQARKRITVSAPTYFVQMNLQGFSTKVEDSADLFQVKAPEGYKAQRVSPLRPQ